MSTALVLLDTHVLVWLDTADPRLGPKSRRACLKAETARTLAVSAVTFWEVALLERRGRMTLARGVASWRSELLDRLLEIPLTGDIGIRAGEFEGLPGDPADRFIAATAMSRNATLLTADERILGWRGKLPRIDARR